ncbi:hypothetical protein THAOC_27415, partial [Thalassiosira oceanica]
MDRPPKPYRPHHAPPEIEGERREEETDGSAHDGRPRRGPVLRGAAPSRAAFVASGPASTARLAVVGRVSPPRGPPAPR